MVLEDAGINLEYMYTFYPQARKQRIAPVRLNPDKAIRVLRKSKINVVGNAELFKRLEN